MPGQSGTETRQKSAAITIRMLPEDHQALAARADAAGLSLADLVRSQVFDRTPDFAPRKQRVPTGAEVALAKILRELTALKAELGKIGSNVNQLAHRANAGERVSRAPLVQAAQTLEVAGQRLRQVVAAIVDALARKSS